MPGLSDIRNAMQRVSALASLTRIASLHRNASLLIVMVAGCNADSGLGTLLDMADMSSPPDVHDAAQGVSGTGTPCDADEECVSRLCVAHRCSASILLERVSEVTTDSPATGIAAGDFNADGLADVAVSGDLPRAGVSVFLAEAGIGLAKRTVVPLPAAAPVVRSVDINQDGRLDLALLGGSIEVLLGDGGGAFLGPVDTALHLWPNSTPSMLLVGDFNEDKAIDARAGAADAKSLNGSIQTAIGNGDGTFSPGATANIVALDGAIGDLNGDGHVDVGTLVLTPINKLALQIELGRGDGTFSVVDGPQLIEAFYGSFRVAVRFADLDGDGWLEIVLLFHDRIEVLEAGPHLSFALRTTVPCNSTAVGLEVSDLNSDGRLDLITPFVDGSVAVFAGTQNGSFLPVGTFSSSLRGVIRLAAADVNGDRRPDLVGIAMEGVRVVTLENRSR